MAFSPEFLASYQRLNPKQKLAVDTIEGPVLVLAGPGTGKTQILTTRIASILEKTDAQPHNILALTFTQSGAHTMQQRLVSLIGAAGYGVKCTTFHSFCVEVIENNQHLFPLSPRRQEAIADVDRIAVVENILLQNDFIHIKSAKNPLYFLRDCLSLISNYKREGWTPLTLLKLLREEESALEQAEGISAAEVRKQQSTLEKNAEVIQVFAEYERILREKQTYDYEDMILWVRDAFLRSPELLLEYQERYQYILVDEFQDTNQSQLQVFLALAEYWGEQANVFVVGDPNQSVYRFQGASLSNVVSFLETFPRATVIALETGYRCAQVIYDAAAALIQQNQSVALDERLSSLHEPLRSGHSHSGTISTFEAANTLSECLWIADQLEHEHAEGTAWREMAVLYRKHAHSQLLQGILRQRGIPFAHAASDNILMHPLVQQILLLLRTLVALRSGKENELLLPLLLLPWWQVQTTDVLKLIRGASASKEHDRSIWNFWSDETAVEALSLSDSTSLFTLRQNLVEWQQAELSQPLANFVQKLLSEIGVYDLVQSQKIPLTDLQVVSSFLQELHRWSILHAEQHLAEFLDRLDRMQSHGLGIATLPLGLQTDVVSILSAHQAKGQEWQTVFILHTNDTYWGNVKSPGSIQPLSHTVPYATLNKMEQNEDERRLFYVALSRAKTKVFLSWSQTEVQNGKSRSLQPSQFIAEIRDVPHQVVPALSEEVVAAQLQGYVMNENTVAFADIDRAWLQSLVNEYSLSVSALNEYLECPVGFVYKRLIRIPVAPVPALVIGTAAHRVMEMYYRRFSDPTQKPVLSELLHFVDTVVASSPLSSREALEITAKTKTLLTEYVDANADTFQPSAAVEQWFGHTPPISFEGLSLNGKIDRIDHVDPLLQTVRVVDYKASKPKSKNELMGLTKNSDLRYYRQLLFYKLLADLDPSFHFTVVEGEFIFLEKNASGKYKSERFSLPAEALDELKDTLRQVKKEFETLAFLEKQPCGHCETCMLLGLQK